MAKQMNAGQKKFVVADKAKKQIELRPFVERRDPGEDRDQRES